MKPSDARALDGFFRRKSSLSIQSAETACSDIGSKDNRLKLGGRLMAMDCKDIVNFAMSSEPGASELLADLIAFSQEKGPVEANHHWHIIADGFLRVEKQRRQTAYTTELQKVAPLKDRLREINEAISGPRKPRNGKCVTTKLVESTAVTANPLPPVVIVEKAASLSAEQQAELLTLIDAQTAKRELSQAVN